MSWEKAAQYTLLASVITWLSNSVGQQGVGKEVMSGYNNTQRTALNIETIQTKVNTRRHHKTPWSRLPIFRARSLSRCWPNREATLGRKRSCRRIYGPLKHQFMARSSSCRCSVEQSWKFASGQSSMFIHAECLLFAGRRLWSIRHQPAPLYSITEAWLLECGSNYRWMEAVFYKSAPVNSVHKRQWLDHRCER